MLSPKKLARWSVFRIDTAREFHGKKPDRIAHYIIFFFETISQEES